MTNTKCRNLLGIFLLGILLLTPVFPAHARQGGAGVQTVEESTLAVPGEEAHTHSYVSEVTREPGCTREGVRTYICLGCSASYTETIPASGHRYLTETVPATASQNGRIIEYCTQCGEGKTTPIYAAKKIKLSKRTFTYNGKVKKPAVSIKDRKGKALVLGRDYLVSYPRGRKNVGRYTVKIRFKGKYTGRVEKTFDIIPQTVKIKKLIPKSKGLTIKWKKQTVQTAGYEIAYSTNKKFSAKSAKTMEIEENKAASRTFLTLKAKKKYYVRIRTYQNVKIDGEPAKFYSSWSKVKSAITKADAAKKIPGFNARPTEENILKILDRYDKDGAYILRSQIAAGNDILAWFAQGGRIIDGIETAVHEEAHGYSYREQVVGETTAFFVGKRKTITVSHTPIYPTVEMARSIPKDLRTARYNTYVAKPAENLTSNIYGVYGLLDEFMAYRAGMNTTVSLYPYYVDKNADTDEWKVFLQNCENGKLAYAEFKYYILQYLAYAKQRHPEVYWGIMGNREFCKAYREIEESYAKLLDKYEKDLGKMQEFLEETGKKVELEKDVIWISEKVSSKTGIGRQTDGEKLQKQMEKKLYRSIHKALIAKGK